MMKSFTEFLNEKVEILSQKQLAKYWDPNIIQQYRKIGSVSARLAKVGEKIDTHIDGKLETTNTAKENSVIVKGVSGEEYIIDKTKFLDRYKGPELTSKNQSYEPTGKVYAMKWENGPATFFASWGETMIIHPGDYLASISKEANGDLYRIEKDVFGKTYQRI